MKTSLKIAAAILMNAIIVKSVGTGIAATGDTDPLALYGDEIVFDVLRKGENVGTHTVRFDRKGRALFVESRFELAIKILFIPVYSFSYLSTARWRDDTIEFLDVDEINCIYADYRDGKFKDDFFIVLTWTSNDGNIYRKTFNQDAESKSNELYIAKAEVDEVKKNFKESDENIKYKVVDPPIPEKVITKVNDSPVLTPPKVIKKPINMLMPLQQKMLTLNVMKQSLPSINDKSLLPPIDKKELVFKSHKKKLFNIRNW